MKIYFVIILIFVCSIILADSPCKNIESLLLINITFEVDMNDEIVSANGVHLAGSFQNWDADETEMFDPDIDGIYAVSVELEAESTVHFRFINGNTWEEEEDVPAEYGVDDGFGGYDREIIVPSEDSTFSFIFGGAPFDNSDVDSSIFISSSLKSYPNPFYTSSANRRNSISISFDLNESKNNPTENLPLQVSIYSIKGRKVKQFFIQDNQTSILWDGRDKSGKLVSAGIYLYSLQIGRNIIGVNKMLVMK